MRPVISWKTRLKIWAERIRQHEDKVLLIPKLVIGVLVGLVVVAFILLTETLVSRMYPEEVLRSGIFSYQFSVRYYGYGLPAEALFPQCTCGRYGQLLGAVVGRLGLEAGLNMLRQEHERIERCGNEASLTFEDGGSGSPRSNKAPARILSRLNDELRILSQMSSAFDQCPTRARVGI